MNSKVRREAIANIRSRDCFVRLSFLAMTSCHNSSFQITCAPSVFLKNSSQKLSNIYKIQYRTASGNKLAKAARKSGFCGILSNSEKNNSDIRTVASYIAVDIVRGWPHFTTGKQSHCSRSVVSRYTRECLRLPHYRFLEHNRNPSNQSHYGCSGSPWRARKCFC